MRIVGEDVACAVRAGAAWPDRGTRRSTPGPRAAPGTLRCRPVRARQVSLPAIWRTAKPTYSHSRPLRGDGDLRARTAPSGSLASGPAGSIVSCAAMRLLSSPSASCPRRFSGRRSRRCWRSATGWPVSRARVAATATSSAFTPSSTVIGGRRPCSTFCAKSSSCVGVGVAEAFHEVRHRVVRDTCLGHDRERRLAQVADAQRAGGAEQLGADVVAVDAVAGQVDDAEPAAREDQADDGVVDVADGAELRVGEAGRRPPAPTSTSPMNQRARSKSWMPWSMIRPPLVFGLAYSTDGGNGSREVDLNTTASPIAPSAEPRLGRRVAAIEAAHEPELEEHAGGLDDLLHVARVGERDGQRLLAEDRLAGRRPRPASPRRAYRSGVTMTTASTDGSSMIAPGSVEASGTSYCAATSSTASCDRSAIAGQARAADACREVAGVDPPEPPQADQADVQPLAAP